MKHSGLVLFLKLNGLKTSRLGYYDPDIHWNPKIIIENGQSIPTTNWTEEITYNLIDFDDSTQIIETRKIEGDFWQRFELEDFPLAN